VRVLVIGALHGDATRGTAVVERLRRVRPPRVALWLVPDLNPDGTALHTRANANGADLDRDLEQPETAALARFVARVRPRVVLWYGGARSGTLLTGAGDRELERRYASRAGVARRASPAGSLVAALGERYPDDTAFSVALAPRAHADRHTRAVLALARAVAPPRVVSRPIPFGAERRRQMRAYSRRHYGLDEHRLLRPRAIVQHYTVTDTFSPVLNHFASNSPDPELGELPGVCSHYVIDRDGTTYQLVSTRLMCRHTVGLNYTAIGIEHVGRSDAQVLGNARQMTASLRLTRMLQGRYRIATRNVIGHNENRSSPLHRERVARLRNQTHGDFPKAVMDRYRRRLGRLPAPASLR
jgi:N-acetylmuramoyl-L-alanine amidase